MLNVGVIGCGDIAITAHFPALRRSKRVKLTAISTRTEERLQMLRKEYSVPFATTDYKELLKRDDVDAVIITTPPWITPQITIEALNSGKHVLCEKPVAMTIEEAEEMKAAAERNGRKLMVGMTYHHDPILHKLRDWVQSGKIGSPVLYRVSIYDETWDPEENPEHYNRIFETLKHGSPSVHEGAHVFDWLHVVNDSEIDQLASYGLKTREEFQNSNYDISILKYKNGDSAKVEIAWFLQVFPEYDFEAVGPKGIASMNSHTRLAVLQTKDETEKYKDEHGWWEHCFDLQTDHFISAIENGGPCRPDIDDAIFTMRATDAVRESMKKGSAVQFADKGK